MVQNLSIALIGKSSKWNMLNKLHEKNTHRTKWDNMEPVDQYTQKHKTDTLSKLNTLTTLDTLNKLHTLNKWKIEQIERIEQHISKSDMDTSSPLNTSNKLDTLHKMIKLSKMESIGRTEQSTPKKQNGHI